MQKNVRFHPTVKTVGFPAHPRKNVLMDPNFISCGWLYTDELKLSNEEILNNIADDIDSGKNVLTNKPAGWA